MANKIYKHIFFDLDHTLWDFEKNSAETLTDLFGLFSLQAKGIPDPAIFIERYHYHNEIFWSQFHKGLITRETLRLIRFETTLKEFGLDDASMFAQMAEKYIEVLPEKKNLFQDTLETLDYLFPKYKLHLITNGFHEVQEKKLVNSGLKRYFTNIITSEVAGAQKPAREIFRFALDRSNATLLDSIFIGDSLEADIEGAKNFGMDYIFYNPQRKAHKEEIMQEIDALSALKSLL